MSVRSVLYQLLIGPVVCPMCNSRNVRLSQCYLIIEHEGDTYVGSLILGDKALTDKICGLLRLHLKRPIKEIGDLDLSYML